VIVHDAAGIIACCGRAILAAATEIMRKEIRAMAWVACHARLAYAARIIRQHDMVTRLDAGHAIAHGLNHARSLMSQDDGKGNRVIGVTNDDIGMTDPYRNNPNEDLSGSRVADAQLFNLKRLAFFANDGRCNLPCLGCC